jgi:hypothetical protein
MLGNDAEGFEGGDLGLNFARNFTGAAAGVFELVGDRVNCPFASLGAQQIPNGSELVFEVFGRYNLLCAL